MIDDVEYEGPRSDTLPGFGWFRAITTNITWYRMSETMMMLFEIFWS
jgi:hypothetical protein